MTRRRPLVFRSSDILNQKVREYFAGREAVFCDPLRQGWWKIRPSSAKNSAVDCVLVGSSPRRFVDLTRLLIPRRRLYVFSESNKKLLLRIFGLRSNEVAVLPRFRLFPLPKEMRPLPGEQIDLVYGGRFATAKGILHLIEVSSLLQTRWKLDVRLYLCGDFDEMTSHNRPQVFNGRRQFQHQVRTLIRSLPWKTRPRIYRDLKPGEWLEKNYRNPVFVSFSQHTHEDFGVALAEAQARGWPAILSSWGAHLDAHLANTILLPAFDLYASNRHRESQRLAKFLAHAFHSTAKARRSRRRSRLASSKRAEEPTILSPSRLAMCLKRAESQFPGFVMATMSQDETFFESKSGRHFHRVLEKILST